MNTFNIRLGYIPRETPAYFVDDRPDGKVWQPDVLPIAAHLARKLHAKRLIDIGCGRGANLKPYAGEFDILGVDYGDNIAYAQRQGFGRWVEHDLESGLPTLNIADLDNSVLVCADVIEHLMHPGGVLFGLISFAKLHAKALVLSTPDRLRTYGFDQNGPPGNPHHVREWTLDELLGYISKNGGKPTWAGWTVSNHVERQKNTALLIFQNRPSAYDVREIEQLFEVEANS